jgi:phage-related protein
MKITIADIDALDSVLRRADDDWSSYYQSGYGLKDFPNRQEWREHVRSVNADLRRVKRLIQRVSRELGGRS